MPSSCGAAQCVPRTRSCRDGSAHPEQQFALPLPVLWFVFKNHVFDGLRRQRPQLSVVVLSPRRVVAFSRANLNRTATIPTVSIHAALTHVTHYRYDRLVTLSPQLVRLRPAPHCRTPILSYTMVVEPAGHFVNWQQDPQSNYVARLTFPEKVREFADRGRSRRRDVGLQPVRLLPRDPRPRAFPFAYERLAAARAAAVSRVASRRRRASPGTSPAIPRTARRTDRLAGRV